VAAAAGFGQALGVDGRGRLFRAEHAMRAMTVDAGGHRVIAGRQGLPVSARPVLALLVDAGRWIELVHIGDVGVAPATERGYVLAVRHAAVGVVGVGGAHGALDVLGQLGIWIAPMAVVTGEPGRPMGVLVETLDERRAVRPEQVAVAVARHTGRFGGLSTDRWHSHQ